MSQVAQPAGLSRESLCRAPSEGGNPGFTTILKVGRALGVRLHVEAAWAASTVTSNTALDRRRHGVAPCRLAHA